MYENSNYCRVDCWTCFFASILLLNMYILHKFFICMFPLIIILHDVFVPYYFFMYYFLNITLAFLWKLYTWFCFCPQCHGCIELRWVKIWHVHPNCYGLTDDMTCDDGESSYVWWLFQLRKNLKSFPFTVHFEKNSQLKCYHNLHGNYFNIYVCPSFHHLSVRQCFRHTFEFSIPEVILQYVTNKSCLVGMCC